MGEEQKWRAEERTRLEQQDPSKGPVWRTCRSAPGSAGLAVCVALALLCAGVCVLELVRSAELRARIARLEQRLPAGTWAPEQVEPFILGRLDQILDEKLAARLPKSREVRDVSHGCLCPPGPDVSISGIIQAFLHNQLHTCPLLAHGECGDNQIDLIMSPDGSH
ncbi:collagen alpha-1(XIII) chain-like [Cololabis saira]|uniref:collagen alpha-1(XIII) chain-like n=1 Tax=Cololabis saira TaxID=129043 RepID=UPI002AD2FE82|nr:collagen alpha-1(XIII) chain-like [Cololabis saira]